LVNRPLEENGFEIALNSQTRLPGQFLLPNNLTQGSSSKVFGFQNPNGFSLKK